MKRILKWVGILLGFLVLAIVIVMVIAHNKGRSRPTAVGVISKITLDDGQQVDYWVSHRPKDKVVMLGCPGVPGWLVSFGTPEVERSLDRDETTLVVIRRVNSDGRWLTPEEKMSAANKVAKLLGMGKVTEMLVWSGGVIDALPILESRQASQYITRVHLDAPAVIDDLSEILTDKERDIFASAREGESLLLDMRALGWIYGREQQVDPAQLSNIKYGLADLMVSMQPRYYESWGKTLKNPDIRWALVGVLAHTGANLEEFRQAAQRVMAMKRSDWRRENFPNAGQIRFELVGHEHDGEVPPESIRLLGEQLGVPANIIAGENHLALLERGIPKHPNKGYNNIRNAAIDL